ncbi:MAG: hypothetical protein AB7P76_10905 [Candidatus Melainabacteria bacterium]
MRAGVTVSHSATQFVNQMMYELQNSPAILSDSTTQEIHYVYHDEVTGNDYSRGYRLSAMGSDKKLERISYNQTTETWGSATSPYGPESATEIKLPAATQFLYCLDATCAGATLLSASFNKAVLVKLSGWQFTRTNGGSTLTLPSDVKIYVGTNLEGTPIQLGAGVRELYSMTGATMFGGTPDLTKLGINQAGDFIFYNGATGGGGGGAGGLTTITPSNTTAPGMIVSEVASDGRVYFGQKTASAKMWTWKSDTGLSTLKSAYSNDISLSLALSPADGRAFWSSVSGSDSMLTYLPGSGLSTVLANRAYTGDTNANVCSDGRLFFGDYNGPDAFYTWRADTGLSTVRTSLAVPGQYQYKNDVCAADGRFFFGDVDRFFTWKSNVLSTILSGRSYPGQASINTASDGRVYFAETSGTNDNVWTWKDGVGLSTVLSSAGYYPAVSASVLGGGDRYFFGEDNGVSSRFWTYTPGTGLSTIVTNVDKPGLHQNYFGITDYVLYNNAIKATSDDRVYFLDGAGWVRTWKAGAGLSTIGSLAANYLVISPTDDRLFIGHMCNNGGCTTQKGYTYTPTTGLSTVINGLMNDAVVDPATGRLYFIYNNYTPTPDDGGVFTWTASTGLSTLLWTTGGTYWALKVSPEGTVFFNNDTSTDGSGTAAKYLALKMATTGGGVTAVNLASALGNPMGTGLSFSIAGSPTYGAVAQDLDGEIYMVDTTGLKLDRYTWDSVDSRYELTTQITLGAWGANVRAVAIDQADNGISLLVYDGASEKKIYRYDNRRSASPTLTTHNLATAMATAPGKPTGLSVNGKTGDYLLMDSTRNGGDPNYYSNVYLLHKTDWNSTGAIAIQDTLKVKTKDSNFISTDVSGETNFKILYDDNRNILYLVAPSASYRKVFAMSLPNLLD